MKTIRRLAFLALFSLATVATAGGPPPQNAPAANSPDYNAPITFTADQLKTLLNERFESVASTGEGDDTTFNLSKLTHVTEDGKQTLSWSVLVKLHTRASRSAAVRIFFPCQALPANPNPARLEELMGMGGAIQDSPAHFVVGGKDRMLYLVVELSSEGLTPGRLQFEIRGLLRAAERTSAMWGAKLDTAKLEKNVLVGEWNVHDGKYNSAGAPPRPIVAGLNAITLTADGKVTAYEREGDENDRKPITLRKGTYTIDGNQLTLAFPDRKTPETYTYQVNEGKLTLTPAKGNVAGITEKTISLNQW